MSAPAGLCPLADLPLSAASGLVERDGTLYVVGDDGWWLCAFGIDGTPRGRVELPGRSPDLPVDRPAPKARKADHEALAVLPDGTLLALGSGSTATRRGAAWVAPGAGTAQRIDCAPLFATIERAVAPLNLEGAAIHGDALVLAQRATRGRGGALVLLDLAGVQRDLGNGVLSATTLRAVRPLELPLLAGLPLSLTDLCAHPDGTLWFTAAAEDTSDPYLDGVCRGSALGRFDRDFAVDRLVALAPVCKIEGLAFDPATPRWLMVADADDPARPSPLFALAQA